MVGWENHPIHLLLGQIVIATMFLFCGAFLIAEAPEWFADKDEEIQKDMADLELDRQAALDRVTTDDLLGRQFGRVS